MAEIKSAGDMMRGAAHALSAQKGHAIGVVAERVVFQRALRPDNYLSFCPRCAERTSRRFGADWMAHMRPLWHLRYKCLYKVSETEGRVMYESRWLCPECRRAVSEEDYIAVYCQPKGQTQVVDLTKVNLDDPSFAMSF